MVQQIAAVVGALILSVALFWIGRSVGRLIEVVDSLSGRVRRCEDGAACLDGEMRDARAALHSRCDRLQAIVEGRSWRDSRLETRDMTRTGVVTMIDLKKPE